ncbi:MAG TPA: Ig-like domain-containing protein [Candidatus Woesebacteria bacterium]|nr:Ig-like domain-containing protein [Candidatus Woesebacteria bacterium]HPJ17310.1 Ig-like domain-containing protein [Candidatus Woesebacteria bacterium]
MQDKKMIVYLVLAVFGIGLSYFLATQVVPKSLVLLTKAAPATKVSIGSSYILGSRILVKADGIDKAVVNVFAMDSSGKGVGGKSVELVGEGVIDPVSQITDNQGKASFKISSNIEKQNEYIAKIEGVALAKTIKVTFRK